MKVTLVSVCPTDAAKAAGRPALTPELLAATGARYSRSNEGLDAIVAKIDPERLDASVDSIFRMLDYGHQSIADMVPVAIFIDGISMWLAYYVWSLCPQAGGQESSTRYIRMKPESLIPAAELGIPADLRVEWDAAMARAFSLYEKLEGAWSSLSEESPGLMRIPSRLMEDKSEKAAKAVARMRRNYAFDRSRYLLPVSIRTNMMLSMSARAWASLCQHLCSSPLEEARALGESVRQELTLGAPRLLRHSGATEDIRLGSEIEFRARMKAASEMPPALAPDAADAAEDTVHLEVFPPAGVTGRDLAEGLANHPNRYAWQGSPLKRTSVRFSWDAVSIAEIRDLNRHRTGSKYSSLIPAGFYGALDQVPPDPSASASAAAVASAVAEASAFGREISAKARKLLAAGDHSYVYWMLLGTQLDFEHVTTADKFIYEAELRTGTGSHYRYARHFHQALDKWYSLYPETKGLILEGSAEPE